MEYPYLELPAGPSKSVFKPIIPVRLSYKKTHKVIKFGLGALLDTGADVCFCDDSIGAWLGVNSKNKKKYSFTAANNQTFETYCEEVTLHIGGIQYQCPFFFSSTLPQNTRLILGTKGFFDHFLVTFNLPERLIKIDPLIRTKS